MKQQGIFTEGISNDIRLYKVLVCDNTSDRCGPDKNLFHMQMLTDVIQPDLHPR